MSALGLVFKSLPPAHIKQAQAPLQLLQWMRRGQQDQRFGNTILQNFTENSPSAINTRFRMSPEEAYALGYRGPVSVRLAPRSAQLPSKAGHEATDIRGEISGEPKSVDSAFLGTHYTPSSLLPREVSELQLEQVAANMHTGWRMLSPLDVYRKYLSNLRQGEIARGSDALASGELEAILASTKDSKLSADILRRYQDYEVDPAIRNALAQQVQDEFRTALSKQGYRGMLYKNTADIGEGFYTDNIGRSLMLLDPRTTVRPYTQGGSV